MGSLVKNRRRCRSRGYENREEEVTVVRRGWGEEWRSQWR